MGVTERRQVMPKEKTIFLILLLLGLGLSACSPIQSEGEATTASQSVSTTPSAMVVCTDDQPCTTPSTTSTTVPSIPTQPADMVPRINPSEAKEAYDQNSAVMIDVRSKQSYNQSHIPGAISIPLDEIPTRWGELNPGDWIITYCT